MKDKILDWVEDHRKLILVLIVIIVLVCIMFGIRSHNLSKKKSDTQVDEGLSTQQQITNNNQQQSTTEEPKPSYESTIKDKVDENKKNDSEVEVEEDETLEELKPNFDVTCSIFGHTSVPNRNMDGSSCKSYLNKVKIADFGTYWGTTLDVNDMQSTTKYLVGVDQDNIQEEIADLKSVGWLITNLGSLGQHDAIKFTNLHVIGSLSDSHVAVLCSYDWYSAYGMKDTLVFFEDISGTLNKDDFVDGSIFSATAFVHNMKVVKVNGQNVVCVQYNVFN